MDVMPASAHVVQNTREPVAPGWLFGAFWRARWLLVICGVVAALLAFGVARLMPRQYTADGQLALETQTFVIPELQGALSTETGPDPMPWVRTEVQVLRSRSLLSAVAEELHLDDDPAFNPRLRPPTIATRVKAILAMLIPGVPAERINDTDASLKQGVVDEINRRLGVVHDNRSLIIALSFMADDPVRASDVLNALMRHYIAARAEARNTANHKANTTFIERISEVRGELETLQRRIQEVRSRNNLIELRAGSVGQQQLEELAAALSRAGAERSQIQANWQEAVQLAQTGSLPTENANVIVSETITRLRDREVEAARRAAEASDRYGPRHPDRRAAEAELAAVRAQIMAEARRVVTALGSQLQAAREREAGIAQQLAQAQQAALQVSTAQAELAELEHEAEGLRVLYRNLQERAVQTTGDPRNAALVPGARIVSLAVPPASASSPRPFMTSAIGFVVGLAFGGMLTVLRRSGVQPFSAPQEIQDETGLPVLGVLRNGGRRGSGTPIQTRVLVAPNGPEAEALRALRGRLRFAGRSRVPQTVLFVSSIAGEGASSAAAAFARVAAFDGSKTLLINGDLQKPALGQILGHPPHNGLVDTLQGRVAWRDVVVNDAMTRLDLLLAAEPQEDAPRLLEGMRLQNLLTDAVEEYSLIVLEGPPAISAAGAMSLSCRADAALLVVQAERTPREVVRRAVEDLSPAARNLAGVVLIQPG